ncbi:uncharacterized protein HMPREF1541_10974 [Cyphellophora europaea CBS 101466]|uniref:Uncharacterized protein n=1 Tax=Cyphellophora europaea (strain CBS 101466) TaxID=1220924 RepID=W2S720_CYPE1|nr:uncharacterized protein HMPREF1541_10974 [Cyphellophora europaea CBS 101466]ETN43843.1 hypothetical protein HMPREF1541_10974 [Cyphellophora europaea CBS 101466]
MLDQPVPENRDAPFTSAGAAPMSNDAGMTDGGSARPDPVKFKQLSQALSLWGDRATVAGIQAFYSQKLKTKWEEEARHKARADANYAGHPKATQQALRLEESARKDFEESKQKATELKLAADGSASVFALQFSTFVSQSIKDVSASGGAADLESLRSQLYELKAHFDRIEQGGSNRNREELQQVSSDIRVLQDRSNAQEARFGTIESDVRHLKSSLTAQIKTELNNALQHLQSKSKPVLQDCEAIKHQVDTAMGNYTASEFNRRNELETLRKDLNQALAENADLKQQMVAIRDQSVSRDEFDSLKREMSQLATANKERVLTPAPTPSLDHKPAIGMLNPYIQRYNEEMQKFGAEVTKTTTSVAYLEKSHESLVPLVHGQKAATDMANSRIDLLLQHLGSLQDQVKNIANRSTISQSSPSHSPSLAPDNIQLQKLRQDTTIRLEEFKKEIQFLTQTNRVLSARYNQLTSERMAEAVAGILGPIPATLQVENQQMKDAIGHLQVTVQQHNHLPGTLKKTSDRVAVLEADIRRMESNKHAGTEQDRRLDAVEKSLEAQVQSVEQPLARLQGKISAIESTLGERLDTVESRVTTQENKTADNLAALVIEQTANSTVSAELFGDFQKEYNSKMTAAENRLDKLEQNVTDQNERQNCLSLKIHQHAHDEIESAKVSIKGHSESLADIEKVCGILNDALKKGLQDLQAKHDALKSTAAEQSQFEELKAIIDEVKNAQEQSSDDLPYISNSDCDDMRKAIDALENRLQDEKRAINQRIETLDGSVEGLKSTAAQAERQTSASILERLTNAEKSIQEVQDKVRAHADTLEAMDEAMLNKFRVTPVTATSTPPSDIKPPTGPRSMSLTPRSMNRNAKKLPKAGERSTSGLGKHRATSPANERPRSRKKPRGPNGEGDGPTLVDLTQDDDGNGETASQNQEPKLGNHSVTRGSR